MDGLFANNNDLTLQIGFIIILANETAPENRVNANPSYTKDSSAAGPNLPEPTPPQPPRRDIFTIRGNIVHYSSIKYKRVTRSVLTSEVYGIVAGVDIAYTLATTLGKITKHLALL